MGKVFVNPAISSISAGTTQATSGQVIFSNANGVSFGLAGQTLTGSVGVGAGGIAASANGNSVSAGTVVWSNSNNVSFGMAGSTITASATVARSEGVAASAVGNSVSAGTVVWSNSNNVSFGMAGSTITASATVARSEGVAASAAGNSVSAGTVVWSNSNNVSFGMAGSTITGSIQPGLSAISAGTTRATSGELVFFDFNGVSFGIVGQTLTASFSSVPAVGMRLLEPTKVISSRTMGQGTLYLQHLNINQSMAVDRVDLFMLISNSSSAAGTMSINAGFYSQTGGSFSLLQSTQRTLAYNSTLAGSSYTNISGARSLSVPFGAAQSLSVGDWWVALGWSVVTGLTSGSYNYFCGASAGPLSGLDYGAVAMPLDGVVSVATNGMAASYLTSDLVYSVSAALAQPWVALMNTNLP